jgi:hypothetical protein
MKRSVLIPVSLAVAALTAPRAPAAVIALFDFAFNVDGVLTANAFPAGVNGAGFDTGTGLGSVQVTVSGAGVHYVGMFVDHEIDETANTFFNETGAPAGVLPAGLSWEVDEPGFVTGDIYDNLTAGALDNGVGVSVGGNTVFLTTFRWRWATSSFWPRKNPRCSRSRWGSCRRPAAFTSYTRTPTAMPAFTTPAR